ncbi:ribosomal protein L22 [Xylariaceae sp. FL0255]|nr:ribosomal protein L22 [Xylariaceae sp. FL0255]
MSLHLPARRATQIAVRATISTSKPSSPSSFHLQNQHAYLLPLTQRRNAWFDIFRGKKNRNVGNEALTRQLTEKEKADRTMQLQERLLNRDQGSTIFDDEIKEGEGEGGRGKVAEKQKKSALDGYSHMKEHTAWGIDPEPRWRTAYQRKKVLQHVRRSNQPLSKAEIIALTEREDHTKTEMLPTSTKKLVPLARQIAGKTVEDAIIQMRFSKKKMAKEVQHQLERARDFAIARAGMGLGQANGEVLETPRKIVTKEGKKLVVRDPTRLYVDQAWVGKGPMRGMRINYHGRGRRSRMRKPSSTLSLILKEEKTRIRLHDERVDKAAKKAPWVHLPNRPVTAQRQYYSW